MKQVSFTSRSPLLKLEAVSKKTSKTKKCIAPKIITGMFVVRKMCELTASIENFQPGLLKIVNTPFLCRQPKESILPLRYRIIDKNMVASR